MSKLIVSVDDEIVNQCFLEHEIFTIGRGESNTLKLDDPMISREHAEITTVVHDQIVADLKSANGTMVNGAKVDKHILQHGDVIELGRFRLKYLNPKVIHGAAFDRTMMAPGAASTGTPARIETSVPAHRNCEDFPLGSLRQLNGTRAETRLKRVLFTLGIAGKNLAVIHRRPQGYFITHVSGRWKARVNGKAIGPEPRALKAEDVIEAGGIKFRFLLHS